MDPRYYQISFLSTFIILGIFVLDFDLEILNAAIVLGSAVATQALMSVLCNLRFEAKSALITALSLILLLRSSYITVHILAAFIAISSKFIIRYRNKHVFNPANIGIVLAIILTDEAWVSPGQWGEVAWVIWLFFLTGFVVLRQVHKLDISCAFLAPYIFLLCVRNYWLGDPLHIVMHQLLNGAFLIFTFFMLSDPKTIPNAPKARVLYAFCIACLSFYLKFSLYIHYNTIYALFILAPMVPFLDKLMPANKFSWINNHTREVT